MTTRAEELSRLWEWSENIRRMLAAGELQEEGRGRGVLIGSDRRKAEHGASDGFRGNQYTIEVVSCQVDNLAEPKTVEVVAEDYGVSPKKVQRATD